MDSWHAVLIGLGDQGANLKRRIVDRLAESSAIGFSARQEVFGHRTANGYEERERLVVSRGQAHVHVHIHAVGEDLFVGWQAHLNWARWSETTPVTRKDFGTYGVAYRDLRPSWHYPGEFDLIDLDSLSSVVHGALKRETKALLSERAVEQEVDFEVNRGERGNALDARKAWPERSTDRKRNSNVIFGSSVVRRIGLGEMQLAPVDVKPSNSRQGLGRIPAVILLPVLAAIGYLWLYQSNSIMLFRFDAQVAPDFPFVFFPLLHLPIAMTIAIGLWVYAGLRLTHALLVIAVIETLTFSTNYLYQVVLSFFVTRRDLSVPGFCTSSILVRSRSPASAICSRHRSGLQRCASGDDGWPQSSYGRSGAWRPSQ